MEARRIYVYSGPETATLGAGEYICAGERARLTAVVMDGPDSIAVFTAGPADDVLLDGDLRPTIREELTAVPEPVDWRMIPAPRRSTQVPSRPLIPTSEWIMELLPHPPLLFWVLQVLTVLFWRAPGHAVLWRWLGGVISRYPLWTAPPEIQTIARVWAAGRPVTWNPIHGFIREESLRGDPKRLLCSIEGPGFWDEWHVLAQDVWAVQAGDLAFLERRQRGFAEDIRQVNERRAAELAETLAQIEQQPGLDGFCRSELRRVASAFLAPLPAE